MRQRYTNYYRALGIVGTHFRDTDIYDDLSLRTAIDLEYCRRCQTYSVPPCECKKPKAVK